MVFANLARMYMFEYHISAVSSDSCTHTNLWMLFYLHLCTALLLRHACLLFYYKIWRTWTENNAQAVLIIWKAFFDEYVNANRNAGVSEWFVGRLIRLCQTCADYRRFNPHRPTRRDATRQFCCVGSGGVNWALTKRSILSSRTAAAQISRLVASFCVTGARTGMNSWKVEYVMQ